MLAHRLALGGNCIVSQSVQRNNVGCGKVKVFGGRGPVRRSPRMFWQRRRERGLLRLANLAEWTTGYATLIIITTMTPPTTRIPFSARHRHPSRSRVEEALPPRLRCHLGLDSCECCGTRYHDGGFHGSRGQWRSMSSNDVLTLRRNR